MKTQRTQNNKIMSAKEKKDFSKIIRTMPWLYRLVLDELKNIDGETLCDVACGDGYLLELINSEYPRFNLSGIDIDGDFIRKARDELGFDIKKQDAFGLKGKFDIITLNLALHHFDNSKKLIKHLLSITNKTLIVSDQIRPETEKELDERVEKRRKFVGVNDVGYYIENERASILEAYSESEIREIFEGFDCKLRFVDGDYYKRFICVIEKGLNMGIGLG